MTNDLKRCQFWVEFIPSHCQYPAPEKLAAQFGVATFSEFCACGCNAFKVTIPAGASVAPIAKPTGHFGAVFECWFYLRGQEKKTLEVLLFADGQGNLAYVDVGCCGNSFPVPEVIEVIEPPFHVHISSTVAP
jgi:hypothetical protein